MEKIEKNSMKKMEVVRAVASRAGVQVQVAQSVMESFVDVIKEGVTDGYKIALKDFGTFDTLTTQARSGVNPQTKQPISIPASQRIVFRAASAWKEAVKKK